MSEDILDTKLTLRRYYKIRFFSLLYKYYKIFFTLLFTDILLK